MVWLSKDTRNILCPHTLSTLAICSCPTDRSIPVYPCLTNGPPFFVPMIVGFKSSVSRPSSPNSMGRPSPIDSTQTPVNIPSPPLTPYLGYDQDTLNDPTGICLDDCIFSSRFRSARKDARADNDTLDTYQRSILRHSTSAPSLPSRMPLRSSTRMPKGFTFSSNISRNQPKDERDSYASFLRTMEEDYWKSVSTIRSTYFFDGIGRGGGFLAVRCLSFFFPCCGQWILSSDVYFCAPTL